MYIQQISIFVENKKGKLAEITDCLYSHNINLRALSIADTADFGILRIITTDPENTLNLLKEAGFTCTMTDVLAVQMSDEPGSMAKIIRVLADNGIAIEYAYAFPTADADSAILVFRVEDNEAAERVLKETPFTLKGIELLDD